MKKTSIALVLSVFVISVYLLSACTKTPEPPVPESTRTITATVTSTFTAENTATITMTATATPTATLTSTPYIYIEAAILKTYASAVIKSDGTPVPAATVYVDDTEDSSDAVALSWDSFGERYIINSYALYNYGHLLRMTVYYDGLTYTAEAEAAGDITIAPDGLSVSFNYPGAVSNSNVNVYNQTNQQLFHTTGSSAIVSPVLIPADTYSGGGTFSIYARQGMTISNAMGAFTGAGAASVLYSFEQVSLQVSK